MTVFGPDISSFEAGLDLSRLADASFVIAKAGEGTYYTDPDYVGWRTQAAHLGKPFVWYHFLTTEDTAAQLAHAKACVGDVSLPGMLDVEPQTQTGSRPTLNQVLAFADAAHAAGWNLRLVYLPEWYWQELGSPSLAGLTSRGLYLVSSNYPGGTGNPLQLYPGDSAAGWQSYGGVTPLIYQYTDKAADGGKNEDYNAFRGSVAQFVAYLGAPTTGGTVILGADDLAAQAAANYNYGKETVNLGGGKVMQNVPLGNLAHGAWVSTNDPVNGPVLLSLARIEAAVKAQSAPVVDVAALAATLGPLLHPTTDVDAVVAGLAAHFGIPDPQAFADELAPLLAAHIKVTSA